MATLALVRHGQSQWNLENRFTGWVDVPLTDLGRIEARRAGELLAATGVHFDVAFTSALVRAQDTLAIMLEVLGQTGLPIERDEALNERHYGSLQGLNKAETAQKYGAEQVHIWRRSYDIPPPEGESLADTAARTLPYFEKAIMPLLRKGKDVLVAAHGNSLRSIVMRLDDLTREQVLELNLDTGVPLLYEFDENGNVVTKRILHP
ncbi:MAG TPA: 2,3-diphosphoglycerate-dependent phosphoglycerate mutase [Candidatus Binatia bacterium]|nr:2,3-diphosphoglycerate-dependent phosphoglycerate mutase [Candidatus Binatia bacterium]